MKRCVRSWLLSTLFAPAVLCLGARAFAAPKDAAATKLSDDAINSDYLATKFIDAQRKLDKAIKMCAGTACSAQVKARLHRNLGVVLIAGLNKTAEGQAAFAEALKTDPKIQLEKDFVTPEIDKAWQAAKGGAPSAAAPPAEEPAEEPAAAASKPQPSGDLIHTPPAEQATLTPVPIYMQLPDGLIATRMVVRYKPFGQTEWKSIDMRRVSKGYGVDLPCVDVGEVAGDLSYYIQVLDEKGELVGASGSRTQPFKVPIKNQLSGDQPHLPGQPPAARCAATTDCPPNFPGCSRGGGVKQWGASCDQDKECAKGLICKGGQCDTGGATTSCDNDTDCDGTKCVDHACEVAAPALKRNLIGINVQADLSILSSESGVCKDGHEARFFCVAIDGYEYAGVPSTETGMGDTIKGGFGVASVRPMIGYDRVLGDNFTLGARLGYGFRLSSGGPKDYFPAHLEGRFAYFLGRAPFQKTRVRPFAALLIGATEFDTKVDVPVIETLTAPAATTFPTVSNRGAYLNDGGQGQTLTVWRRSRTAFAGLAVGTMIPVGGPTSGFLFELKWMLSFPDPGMILAPSIGYVIGL